MFFGYRIFAACLALAMSATWTICPCSKADASVRAAVVESKPACPRCHSTPHNTTKPIRSAPCDGCKLANRVDRPAAKLVAAHPHLFLATIPMPILPAVAGVCVMVPDHVQTGPPLLLDLFHSGCLLTV